ncbi:histidine phosphatase family protein [Pseudogemmatithrix spongiicola]|uniref:Histidine phosphatase family protein n=1 Tax=Pseudogemmatithrix spongiicola TaxID=3062599 RepID=A0AA49JXM1_9BACT|nr:histidine phosphatase family protein [Gemmatimonadaceae bacterium 'strain 138']WKW13944.1 histidine phosphatase family protein [Gemmatimonadaceae bacterium 'strain 318']
MRLILRSLLALAFPAALVAQQHDSTHHRPGEAHEEPTIVIVVRHAERGTEPADDPRLTPAGEARALALVEALRGAKVDVVLHTPRVRTRDTALPVARHFGITPEVVPLTPGASHVEAMAAAVRKHHGKTVVVVGHSNTIMQYIAALGGPRRGDLCDHQYNGLYTLVLIHGEAHLVEGQYGGPNPPPAPGCNTMTAPSMRP